MADIVKQYALKATVFIPFVIILIATSIGLIIVGCIDINTVEVVENEKVIDYTYCMDYNNKSCSIEAVESSRGWCECSIIVNLTEPLNGNVSFLYELETFDQSRSEYKNSRDDQQLMGILSETPSEACEPYRYTVPDKRPIAPCGIIADSLFLDSYSIQDNDKKSRIKYTISGILSEEEKKGFKIPTNVSLLGSTFAFPSGWPEEYKSAGSQRIFENEWFIGWMNTDLKRKPFGRLDKGLEKGEYIVNITYRKNNYYNGTRKIIFYSKQHVQGLHVASKIGLAIGCVMLLLTLVAVGLVLRFYPYIFNNSKIDSNPKSNGSTLEPSSPELNPLKPPNADEKYIF